jgi:hypothetical protein
MAGTRDHCNEPWGFIKGGESRINAAAVLAIVVLSFVMLSRSAKCRLASKRTSALLVFSVRRYVGVIFFSYLQYLQGDQMIVV